MKSSFWLILIISCFLSTQLLIAQSPKISHSVFSKKEGLEIDYIRTMAMDNDGYLWIGGTSLNVREIINSDNKITLQRFNGRDFHNIALPDIPVEITTVDQIYKRTDGKFYIRCFNANGSLFYLFDPITIHYTPISLMEGNLTARSTSKIFSFKGRNYFLYQKDTEIVICEIIENLEVKTLFSYKYTASRFLLDQSTVLLLHDNYVAIGDDNFPIHFFDWKGNLLDKMSNKNFVSIEDHAERKYFIESYFKKDDTFYIFLDRNDRLHKIDNETLKIIPVEGVNATRPNLHLTSINDQNDTPLIVTSSNRDAEIATFSKDGFNSVTVPTLFQKTSSMTVYSDDCAVDVWIGNDRRELHYLKFPSKKVKTLLTDKSIRSIKSLDEKNYIVATESSGWFTLNKESMEVAPLDLWENGVKSKPYSSRNILNNGTTLWSNDNGNIIEVDLATFNLKGYRHYPVLCLERLNDSTLIYGTNDYNLMAFDTNTKVHYPVFETKGIIIYDIAIRDNRLVGATDKGIFSYNFISKNKTWIDHPTSVDDPYFLMADYIDELGFVLGSRKGDVISFDVKKEITQSIYKDDLKAGIATLILDKDLLWINTFNGIVSYNLKTKAIQRFSVEDGFSDNEANRYSALKTPDGFFVGTISGLNFFNPEQLQLLKKQTSLKLLKLRHYVSKEKRVIDNFNISEIHNGAPIIIPAEFKELSLDFGLTHNTAPNECRYRYKLGNTEWININQQQSLSFPSLAAGKYELEIEALNFSGNKVGESLVLQIDSKAFFYKKWWFIIGISFIVISILLYLLQQSQLRQIMQQKFARDLIGSQEKERKRIAKDLHDSVGQRLTLIKRKTQNQEEKELTEMTNDVLEEVRSISRGLYPANLKVLGLTKSIKQLVYEIDEQTDLFITLELENIDTHFDEEGKLNIYRFVQESFSNILKHANAKEVSLLTKTTSTHVIIKIDDNGVGFLANEKRKLNSLGLKTIEERIAVVNGKLEIISQRNTGTQLIATIPIK